MWRCPLPFESEAADLLDRKATQVFAGKVVRKDLVRKLKFGSTVPVYVLEYLLGKFCATDDPMAVEAGLKIVHSTLEENFVRPDESNRIAGEGAGAVLADRQGEGPVRVR